jgi:hypothetical protein
MPHFQRFSRARELRLRATAACAFLFGITGCSEHVGCLQGSFPAISAHVTSAGSGASLTAALGEVREGSFGDSLFGFGDGTYVAAYDRGGTYDVHVVHAGYAAWDTTGVLVEETGGSCSLVQTEEIDVRLQALP